MKHTLPAFLTAITGGGVTFFLAYSCFRDVLAFETEIRIRSRGALQHLTWILSGILLALVLLLPSTFGGTNERLWSFVRIGAAIGACLAGLRHLITGSIMDSSYDRLLTFWASISLCILAALLPVTYVASLVTVAAETAVGSEVRSLALRSLFHGSTLGIILFLAFVLYSRLTLKYLMLALKIQQGYSVIAAVALLAIACVHAKSATLMCITLCSVSVGMGISALSTRWYWWRDMKARKWALSGLLFACAATSLVIAESSVVFDFSLAEASYYTSLLMASVGIVAGSFILSLKSQGL